VELFMELNCVLRRLPVQLLAPLMDTGEIAGVVECVSLLQASVELCASGAARGVVYRGFCTGGASLEKVYRSAIGKVILWRGFAAAGRDRARVLKECVGKENGILFIITLGPQAVVADLGGGEVLIAAETAFRIDDVTRTDDGVAVVLMECVAVWSDAELNGNPWEL
jgi:hypothetical protein